MRLTKKNKYGYEDINECVITDCSDKLGQLEDIEDELGIDLITLFKALDNGIYIKSEIHGGAIRFIPSVCLVFDSEYLYELKYCKCYKKLKENVYPFEFKDYGKTWALTREELEK